MATFACLTCFSSISQEGLRRLAEGYVVSRLLSRLIRIDPRACLQGNLLPLSVPRASPLQVKCGTSWLVSHGFSTIRLSLGNNHKSLLWMDNIHFAPPKKPMMIPLQVPTNVFSHGLQVAQLSQWFSTVLRQSGGPGPEQPAPEACGLGAPLV